MDYMMTDNNDKSNRSPSTNSTISKSQFQNQDTGAMNTAKYIFLQRVSEGISYLVDRHGYSRDRASKLILGEIRKTEPVPSEDEVSFIQISNV